MRLKKWWNRYIVKPGSMVLVYASQGRATPTLYVLAYRPNYAVLYLLLAIYNFGPSPLSDFHKEPWAMVFKKSNDNNDLTTIWIKIPVSTVGETLQLQCKHPRINNIIQIIQLGSRICRTMRPDVILSYFSIIYQGSYIEEEKMIQYWLWNISSMGW